MIKQHLKGWNHLKFGLWWHRVILWEHQLLKCGKHHLANAAQMGTKLHCSVITAFMAAKTQIQANQSSKWRSSRCLIFSPHGLMAQSSAEGRVLSIGSAFWVNKQQFICSVRLKHPVLTGGRFWEVAGVCQDAGKRVQVLIIYKDVKRET